MKFGLFGFLGSVYMEVGSPDRWGNTWQVIQKCRRDYMDRRATHLSGLPQLTGVPHFHVNRPLGVYPKTVFVLPAVCIDKSGEL